MQRIRKERHLLVLIGICLILTGIIPIKAFCDDTKWIAIGMLQDWFSSAGCEREVGRRNLTRDQQDGLQWPAQFIYQDMKAAKGMWMGAKDYDDPVAGKVFSYKVVHVGPRVLDDDSEIFPQEFTTYGQFDHPLVYVDNVESSDLTNLDLEVNVDASIPTDRMIVNKLHTAMGLSLTRTIYASSQRDNDNYFIYDYVFKNTGIYNNNGAIKTQTLKDVVIMFQYRYAVSKWICVYGFGVAPQSAAWGHNTMNDILLPSWGDDLRAIYAWHGLHSAYTYQGSAIDNIGGPNVGSSSRVADGFLGAAQFCGVVVIHADKSANDESDDPNQPSSTPYFSSDATYTSGNDQYNESGMATEYSVMTSGIPARSMADEVGTQATNLWVSSTTGGSGGISQAISFGPYTLAPDEDIHIVLAEAVNGLSWNERIRIGKQWFNKTTPYYLPDGSTTNSADEFKDTWVYTGKDSIQKTFRRAKSVWENNFNIETPPPPPDQFFVSSGGDRIMLEWSNSAESYANFGGYRVYRAVQTADTLFDLIYECGQGTNNDLTNTFDDKTAVRGFDYYYYITTYDDGKVSSTGKVLESSLFWTRTSDPAYLRRMPGTSLKDIRIVPNPYNISAQNDYQFGSSLPDRLMFYNIPPKCIIRIYTEAGELIKTIHHTNSSGDESWDSNTSSKQVVVSGVYIAHFEVTEDYDDPITGERLFSKGETTFQKFVVIR